MKKTIILSLIIVPVVFTACCDFRSNEEHLNEHINTDSVVSEDTIPVDSLMLDTGQYVDEEQETQELIEEIYGEQWDFCDCVVKNDSINRVVEEAPDDADFDAIFARMDEIDMHCKEMLTTPNTTPEEREKHERRVRKCLKNAK